jgi:hypothetical protein
MIVSSPSFSGLRHSINGSGTFPRQQAALAATTHCAPPAPQPCGQCAFPLRFPSIRRFSKRRKACLPANRHPAEDRPQISADILAQNAPPCLSGRRWCVFVAGTGLALGAGRKPPRRSRPRATQASLDTTVRACTSCAMANSGGARTSSAYRA